MDIAMRARWWDLRARQEAHAAAVFERLVEDALDLKLGGTLADELQEAALDERRHAVACAARARQLGVSEGATAGLPAPTTPLGAWGARQRFAMHMVGSLCVGESVSVAVLAQAVRDPVGDDADQQLDREILRDEARHARLGFAWLASWRGLPYSLRLAVQAWLPDVLTYHLSSRRGEVRIAVERALATRIVPRLERHGVHVAGGRP